MLANPLEIRGRHRVTNMNPEATFEDYLRELPARLAKFGLALAEEKSALVKFNRREGESSGKFTFVGFDFYWGKSRRPK